MHAGIVNAGGYVLIRLSPLLAEASWALMSLAMLGAFTAVFGALVMLTQTSIKRSLAWSTIAQMGFMMLQCGLGAFSAAMLHLIAHSLYKAHAFLNSGDVLNQASAMKATRSPGASLSPVPALSPSLPLSGNPAGRSAGAGSSSSGTAATEFPPRSLGWTAMATVSIYAGVCALTGLDPAAKSGGFLLGFLLCLGLTRWVWQSTWTRRSLELATALVVTGVLCGIYAVSFLSVDSVVASSFGPFSASAHSSPAALAAEHTLAGIVPGFGAGDSAGANGGAGLASGIWLLIAGSFTATGFVTLFLLESWLCLCPGGSARRSHPRPSSPHAPADASASTPGSSASMPRSNASMPSWPPWLQAAYVHASNGFYVDAVLHRSLRAVTSREPFPRNASVSVVSRISRKGTVQ